MAAKFKRWKLSLDKVKAFGALLTDLLKAFDCLSLDLIIAKLNTHGFSPSALKLIQIYLTEKKQTTKNNQAYSYWEEIYFDVLQVSILNPILFDIFLSDSFILIQNINFASFADDSTIYHASGYIDEIRFSLPESK